MPTYNLQCAVTCNLTFVVEADNEDDAIAEVRAGGGDCVDHSLDEGTHALSDVEFYIEEEP